MSVIARLLPDNPVLTKELRVRMRGSRAYWILFGYLGFLALVLLFQYWGFLEGVRASGSGASDVSRIGESIYNAIVLTQVFLVLFITPAITSGTLTIEREQQTMDLLTLTRLPRRSIIAGKLLSAVAFTSLLLVSSLPLLSICFMLGSVDPGMVFSVYMMLLLGSVLIGAMGLMWSSIARTTTQAVMYTYATLFILFLFGAMNYGGSMASQGSYHSGNLFENLFVAVGSSWFGKTFLGVTGPEGLGFAVLCLLASLLLATVARTRLEMYPERLGKTLRILTALVIGVQTLAINAWWLDMWYNRAGKAVQIAVQPPLAALIITAMLLMLVVPIFATGDLAPGDIKNFKAYLKSGWKPSGLSIGKMTSGLPYLILLTAFCLFLYALPFVFMGKAGDIGRSGFIAQMGKIPAGNQTNGPATFTPAPQTAMPLPAVSSAPTMNLAMKQGDLAQAAIVLFASVIGFALLCYFLSALCRNRWVAWMLATLFLFIIWIVPTIARANGSQYSLPGIEINLFYLNPMIALCEMSDSYNQFAQYLLFENVLPIWQVTTLLWLGIGALSLIGTFALVGRQKRKLAATQTSLPTLSPSV